MYCFSICYYMHSFMYDNFFKLHGYIYTCIHVHMYFVLTCTCTRKCQQLYSGTSLIRTRLGQKKAPLLVRYPDFRGCNVHKQGDWDSQMCPVCRGVPISGVS